MSEKKFIKFLLVVVVVGLLFVAYGKCVQMETIKSAELLEVNENGYTISFDGQEHNYKF